MALDFSQVYKINVPVNGTNKEVKKIEDANGNILWQFKTKYRKLSSIGWWCSSTANADKYKGWYIPLDFSFPEKAGQDIEIAAQWYQNQIRYAPLISNYVDGNNYTKFVINVNQDGGNCPYIVYNDGNHNQWATSQALSNAIWNSSISPEQCSYIWTNQLQTTAAFRKRNSNASTNYNCDTDFPNVLGNYTNLNLTYHFATSSMQAAGKNSDFFCNTSSDTDRHWRGKFYKCIMGVRDSNGLVLDHEFYPAQRKSDNRIGLYDAITNKFYPEMNNYKYNNYNLQIGPVIEENPEGWM